MLRYGLVFALLIQAGLGLPFPASLWEGRKNPYAYLGMVNSVILEIGDLIWPGEHVVYSDDPEVNMTVPEMIEYHGYPSEVHTIQTADGYILDIHRIPHGVNSVGSEPRQPVLLMHNILQASGEWVMDFPHNSLGYVLADAGYDVWLGNVRGNTYGRKHVSLAPNQEAFWKFSWEERAEKDLPAMIEYIREKTGQGKLHYLGHGVGATMMFALLSSQPEYNEKVRSFVSFSPALEFKHATSPLKYAAMFGGVWEEVLHRIGFLELFPNGIMEPIVGHGVMHHQTYMVPFLKTLLVLYYGLSPNSQLNTTRIPVYLNMVPAGTSVDTVGHLEQLLSSGNFQRFDYGGLGNSQKYSAPFPPLFNLEQVKASTILCVSDSDPLVSDKDVKSFSSRLSNIHKTITVSGFDHMDFIWAPEAKQALWDDVISEMKKL